MKAKCFVKSKNYYICYSMLFVLLSLFVCLPFLLKGNSFVNVGDGYDEMYPVFIYSGDYYRTLFRNVGKRIPQYDFSIGFGGDIIGFLNCFGFNSAFSLFSIFAVGKYSVFIYSLTVLLKLYFAGISFSYYLFIKCTEIKNRAVLVAAFTYVFSTYSIYYGLQFPTFLDILVYLPLAIAGIEKLLRRKTRYCLVPALILAFWLQALSGFYHLYMLTLFCIIHFLICYFTQENDMVKFIKMFFCLTLNIIIAFCLSGIVLVPSILAYLNSTRTEESNFLQILFTVYSKDDVLKNLVHIFLKEGYHSGLGIGVLSGLALIMLILRKGWKEYKILLLVFGIGYFLPAFGSVMNGFAYATDRWIFMLIFIISSLTGEMLSDKRQLDRKEVIGFLGLAIIFCCLFWYNRELSKSSILKFGIYGLMWGGAIRISWEISKNGTGCLIENKRIYLVGIACIAVSSFMVNAPVKIGGGGWSACFLSNDEVYESIQNSLANIEGEGDFYRVDICDASEGSSLILHNYGTASYYSVTNKNIYEFFRQLKISSGIRNVSFRMVGLDQRSILRNILAVRYFVNNDQVVENIDAGGLGILFDSYCMEKQSKEMSAMERNLLVDRNIILEEIPAGDINETNMQNKDWKVKKLQHKIKYVNVGLENNNLFIEKEGKIRISVENSGLDEYILLKELKINNKDLVDIQIGNVSIQLRGEENRGYLQGDNDYLIYLGKDIEQIDLCFESGNYSLEGIEVYGVDYRSISGVERENLGQLDLKTDSNRIYGKVNVSQDRLLFLSVPYSEGWKYYIDGEKVKGYRANYGFTAIVIPAGEHMVEADYHTPGMRIGAMLTVLAIVVVVVSLFKQSKQEKL